MELRNLISFIHVAELGSFTKAAERLGYSQSTISFQIKQLEDELGCLLFERINHTITLTEKGRELVSYAHQVRALTEDFKESLTRDEDIRLTVVWKRSPRKKAEHYLLFRVDSESAITSDDVKGFERFDTVESVSLWDLSYASVDGHGVIELDSEEQLVRSWLETKLRVAPVDKNIYEKYCPVCRSKDNESDDGIYVCHACGSEYLFGEDGGRDVVWFRRIRK